MYVKIMLILIPLLTIGIPIKSFAQNIDEEPKGNSITDKLWVGANVGLSEPWGDPGTGTSYETGFAFKAFGQYDLGDVVPNLRAEISIGYSTWSRSSGTAGSESVIPILVNGVYKLADITPKVSLFGYGGIGFNLHSWDSANSDFDYESQSVIGFNIGVGGNYPVNEQIEVNLRIGGYLSMTSSLESTLTASGSTVTSPEDFSHTETPVLIGITYKL